MIANSFKISSFNLLESEYKLFQSFKSQITTELQTLFPSNQEKISFYSSDDHLIRLLIAREYNLKKSLEMWRKWVEWRQEYKVDDILESEIDGELRSGKAFWHKYDKQNHPCLIVKTKRHTPKESDMGVMMKFIVFLIEKGIKESDRIGGQGKICVLWDRKGFTMKNYDKRFLGLMKKLNGVLQDNYAERLDTLYILYPNWFFKSMYAIIKPFLNQKTKNKIKLINDVKDLEKFFDKDCLMRDMGGQSDFVYKYKDAVFDEIQAKNEVIDAKEEEELKKLGNDLLKEEGLNIDNSDFD